MDITPELAGICNTIITKFLSKTPLNDGDAFADAVPEDAKAKGLDTQASRVVSAASPDTRVP